MELKTLNNTPEHILSAKDFAKSFGLVVAVNPDGSVVTRLIGGEWDNGICDAVEEVHSLYPNSEIKLLLETYDLKYWRGIPR